MAKNIWRIGLTGGIGSGKSVVARTFLACGASIIDADAIARNVTLAGGAAIDEIAREFGFEAIGPNGAMNRDYMRQLIFKDSTARQRLEAIIHPLVSQEADRQLNAAVVAGFGCVVFDIPLLVESGVHWRQQLDVVCVVDCTEATQIARVMARNGWSQKVVQSIIEGQVSRIQRLAAADLCLVNENLSLEEFVFQVQQVALDFLI